MLPCSVQRKRVCVGCAGKIAQEWCILIRKMIWLLFRSVVLYQGCRLCGCFSIWCSRWQSVCCACDPMPLALGCWRSLPSPSFGSGSLFSEQLALAQGCMAERGTLCQPRRTGQSGSVCSWGFIPSWWEGGRDKMLCPCQ